MDIEFEWDDAKAIGNLRKHGVSFVQATQVFRDPFGIEWLDERASYEEERFIICGMSGGALLTVVYTEREPRIRIISARRANRYEKEEYDRANAT